MLTLAPRFSDGPSTIFKSRCSDIIAKIFMLRVAWRRPRWHFSRYSIHLARRYTQGKQRHSGLRVSIDMQIRWTWLTRIFRSEEKMCRGDRSARGHGAQLWEARRGDFTVHLYLVSRSFTPNRHSRETEYGTSFKRAMERCPDGCE